MNNKEIREIFKNNLKVKAISIKDISKGVDQKVKIVSTDKGKFIFKFPKRQVFNFREFFACKKLIGKIPVPKIILKRRSFIIESFLEGTDLDEVKLSGREDKIIYSQLGLFLKKIHTIKMKGFGDVGFNGKGEFKTLREAVSPEIRNYLKRIKTSKLFSKEEVDKLENYLRKKDHLLDSKQSVLLHIDYEESNIKVKNGKVSGILDFGDLASGPKALDFARPFVSYYKNKKFDYFVKGYGKINLKEVEFYGVLFLLWKILYPHPRNQKGMKKRLRNLGEILN